MRSSSSDRPSFLIPAVAAALTALVTVLAACGSEQSSAFDATRNAPEPGGESAGFGQEPPPNELISDASAPNGDQYRGSPLCHIDEQTCDPDDDGTKTVGSNATYAVKCAVAPDPDAAVVSSKGCRLSGATAAPACLDANAQNTDGAKCETGADCAPGFDCVTSNDVGYCRRYCCSGSCGTNRSQSGAETFCDVQSLQRTDGSSTRAPVCMPIKTCKLFLEGECAEDETCSVVTDDGKTGCVANGTATANQPCDQEHCIAGLACLGQAGSRKCLQLCRTKNGPGCAANQICKPSSISADPTLGTCAPAP